jgi:hypothetical protein
MYSVRLSEYRAVMLKAPVFDDCSIIIIDLISVLLQFSDANYRLTLGYHGVTFSYFTYNYIYFTLLNHLFLTMSKYFPTFCTCVLFVVFNIFL